MNSIDSIAQINAWAKSDAHRELQARLKRAGEKPAPKKARPAKKV